MSWQGPYVPLRPSLQLTVGLLLGSCDNTVALFETVNDNSHVVNDMTVVVRRDHYEDLREAVRQLEDSVGKLRAELQAVNGK